MSENHCNRFLLLVAFFYSTIVLYALMEIIIPHVNRVLKKEATVLADGLCWPTKAVSNNSYNATTADRTYFVSPICGGLIAFTLGW